jgi:hypothetical protein
MLSNAMLFPSIPLSYLPYLQLLLYIELFTIHNLFPLMKRELFHFLIHSAQFRHVLMNCWTLKYGSSNPVASVVLVTKQAVLIHLLKRL